MFDQIFSQEKFGFNISEANRSIRFVINTIARVSDQCFPDSGSDSDDEGSVTDEEDMKWINNVIESEYDLSDLEKHLFFIDPLPNRCCCKAISPNPNKQRYCYVKNFLNLLAKTGFEDNKKVEVKDYVSVSIGLNKMLSLSDRENNALFAAKTEYDFGDMNCNIFSFYWEPQWKSKRTNENVNYEKVRSVYKQLKKRNKNAAEVFRKTAESKALPPYQHLREFAKNHEKTKELIQKWKRQNIETRIYLHLVDFDTESFNGIYSAYLRILENGKIPTVMSTGYEFRNVPMPFILASQLDRKIRIITNEYVQGGVYFPEPNTCILIENGKDTLTESFMDNKRGDGRTMETPILLSNLKKQRESVTFMFSSDNPIIITLPERFKYNPQNKNILFGSNLSRELKEGFGTFTEKDIKGLSRFCQSHFDKLQWWHNLCINGLNEEMKKPFAKKMLKQLFNGDDTDLDEILENIGPQIVGNLMLAHAEFTKFKDDVVKNARGEVETKLWKLFDEKGFHRFSDDEKSVVSILRSYGIIDLFDPNSIFAIIEKMGEEEVPAADLIMLMRIHLVGYEVEDVIKIYKEKPEYLNVLDQKKSYVDLVMDCFDASFVDSEEFIRYFEYRFNVNLEEVHTKLEDAASWEDNEKKKREKEERFSIFQKIMEKLQREEDNTYADEEEENDLNSFTDYQLEHMNYL